MDVQFQNGKILHGDVLDRLKDIPDSSVDLITTDPPYGYSFMNKDWDKAVVKADVWKKCLRVLKPGAFAFVMSAPRQDVLSHMIVNLTDAGFVMGFTSMYWAYASGFPKAMNISKAVDKKLGHNREITGKDQCFGSQDSEIYGFNTTGKNKTEFDKKDKPASEQAKRLDGSYAGFQPKPAVEVILVCMKPLSEKNYVEQALENGKGVTWFDDCRIPYKNDGDKESTTWGNQTWKSNDYSFKPEHLKQDTKNIEGNSQGRFPANLLVSDNSLDVGKKTKSSKKSGKHGLGSIKFNQGELGDDESIRGYEDEGDFSRYYSLDSWKAQFIITPKPSKSEKNKGLDSFVTEQVNDGRNIPPDNAFQRGKTQRQNTHPTVKPVSLFKYLVTLGSRTNDIVLDPFMGSGTTAIACEELARSWIGIELNEKYVEICKKRLASHNSLRLDKFV